MIGNALMGNKNFQQHSNSVNRSAYHQQKSSGTSTKKSFFGGSKTGSSSSGSRTYGS